MIEKFDEFGEPKRGKFNIKEILSKGKDFTKGVWDAVKREKRETAQALGILQRMVKGEKVTEKEKLFLKRQSKDLAKILPLIAIQGIPVPVPITPFLIALGNKYGFSILPTSQEVLGKEIESERSEKENKLKGFDNFGSE